MVGDWSPTFDGLNEARTFLNVDREASTAEVEQAFHRALEEADRASAIEARELVLADSLYVGQAVARILCERLHPDDLASVLDAQSLLGGAAPPADGAAGYHRGIARTADQTVARLEELRDSNPDVTSERIQTVRVAQYALRYRDVEAGRKYVLGSDADPEEESGWRGPLSPSWKYSVNTSDGTEFYVHGDRQIELHQDEEGASYSTRFLRDGDLIDEATFHRYGEAHRMVKRWVTDPPNPE